MQHDPALFANVQCSYSTAVTKFDLWGLQAALMFPLYISKCTSNTHLSILFLTS